MSDSRWKLQDAEQFVNRCRSCGCEVSREIKCGMSVFVMCSTCLREIADEMDRRSGNFSEQGSTS